MHPNIVFCYTSLTQFRGKNANFTAGYIILCRISWVTVWRTSSHSRKKSINLLANIAPGLGSIILFIFFFAIYYMICHLSYWKQFIQILIPITRFCHYKIVMYNFTSVFCRLCNKKKIGTTSIKLILFRSSFTNQIKIRQQKAQSAFWSMAIYFPSNFEE